MPLPESPALPEEMKKQPSKSDDQAKQSRTSKIILSNDSKKPKSKDKNID